MSEPQPLSLPPINALQVQLFEALDGEAPADVYDNVPEHVVKPWITIGDAIAIPDNWHGGFGWDILSTIHVWTKSHGFKPTLDIVNQVAAILDHKRASLALPDSWYVVSIRFVQLQTLRDPDPEIRHVPVQFRIVIHQDT